MRAHGKATRRQRHVRVFDIRYHHKRDDKIVFETSITFVCVNADDNKTKNID